MKDYLKEYLYNYHWDPSKTLLRAIEAGLMENLKFEEPILDLGCGDGTFVSVLLGKSKVVGLDYKVRNILRARKRQVYSGLLSCDARRLAFKKNVFSTLLINSFLEHINEQNLKDVLLEANRVLRNAGRLIVTVNSDLFGRHDPLVTSLERLGLQGLSTAWQRYRNKRLALVSLKDEAYWQKLFIDTGFKILESRYYLPVSSERKFFFWLNIQYLGISRLNLGSITRTLSKLLSFFHINLHRRLIASVFRQALKNDYLVESNSGSCLFFSLEKDGSLKSFAEVKDKIEKNLGNIERITVSASPVVSVIIPAFYSERRENLARLIEDLKRQTFEEIEILIVKGISPQGKAINLGTKFSRGQILLITDDDSRIDNRHLIENLVKVLDNDKDVGMVGASILVPPDANWLQRVAGREFPRFGMKVMDKVTESDMACHGCCAIPKKIFEEVGGERENILRGLDPDLRVRLRKKGYKTVIAANTWVYHPLPETLGKFIKTFWRNGMGSAYCLRFQPELIYDTDESMELKSFKERVPFVFRIFRFPVRLFRALIEFKFLRLLAYLIYAIGFCYGIVKYSIVKRLKL